MQQMQHVQARALLDLHEDRRHHQKVNTLQQPNHKHLHFQEEEEQQHEMHQHQDLPSHPAGPDTASKEEEEERLLEALPPAERAAALQLRQQVVALRQELASVSVGYTSCMQQTKAETGLETSDLETFQQGWSEEGIKSMGLSDSVSVSSACKGPPESASLFAASLLGNLTRRLFDFSSTFQCSTSHTTTHSYWSFVKNYPGSRMGAASATVSTVPTHDNPLLQDRKTERPFSERHEREGQPCLGEQALADMAMPNIPPNAPHWWSTWLAYWGQ